MVPPGPLADAAQLSRIASRMNYGALTMGRCAGKVKPRPRRRSLLDFAPDHVDRVENRDQVGHRVAFDQPRERGEDGEAGPAHLDGVGLALSIRDDVKAELAVRPLGVDVD